MMDTTQSGAMKTLLVVSAAFGGAFVGTLAIHAFAPAPALMASFSAAEKIKPAFKVELNEKVKTPDEKAIPVQAGEDSSSWETGSLARLPDLIAEANSAGKYMFLWDKQGSVAIFMQYKGLLRQLGPGVLNAALGRADIKEVGETVRKGFVDGMRAGSNLCLDIDRTKANFNQMNQEGTFVGNQIFDYAWMNKEANYMTYVREDENHGLGGINPGVGYFRQESFSCMIRSGAEDEDTVREQIALIPHFDQFKKVIIE